MIVMSLRNATIPRAHLAVSVTKVTQETEQIASVRTTFQSFIFLNCPPPSVTKLCLPLV